MLYRAFFTLHSFFLIILLVPFACPHSFTPNFFHKCTHTRTYIHAHIHTHIHTHIGGGRPCDHRNRSRDTRLRELQSSVQDSDQQVALPSNYSIHATPCNLSYSILFYPIKYDFEVYLRLQQHLIDIIMFTITSPHATHALF